MTKYKTFSEIKRGDILYGITISDICVQFKKIKVIGFEDVFSDDTIIYTYINDSPLMFDFYKNESSWMNTIFTTKEEAIETAKQQINKKINDMCERIKFFSDKLVNINDIEFR